MTVTLADAVPDMDDGDVEYDVDSIEWYNQAALEKTRPEGEFFEASMAKMREEAHAKSAIKDMKALLNRTNNVLSL
jgi:hypothetical protein